MASDGEESGTVDIMTAELARVVAPLGEAGRAAGNGRFEPLFTLLADIGIGEALEDDQFDQLGTVVAKVGGHWSTIQTNVVDPLQNDEVPTPTEIEAAGKAVVKTFDILKDLDGLEPPSLPDSLTLPEVVVDYLLARYLDQHHPEYYAALCLGNVIVNDASEEPTEVDFSVLPEMVQEPKTIPSKVFDWGKPGFKAYSVVYYVSLLTEQFVPVARTETADVFQWDKTEERQNQLSRQLNAPFISTRPNPTTSLLLGTKLTPVPPHGNKNPGLALVPYASGNFEKTYDLGNGWEFRAKLGAKVQDWALVAQPSGGSTDVGIKVLHGTLPINPEDMLPPDDPQAPVSGLPDLHAEAELSYTGEDGGRTLVIGSRDGGGLYLNDVSVRGILDTADDGPGFAAELPVNTSLEVKPEGGFVTKVLPKSFGSSIKVTPGYAPPKGFYVDAGATLEIPIPVHESLGPITLKEIYLALSVTTDPEEGAAPVTITGAASASLTLGPIVGTVDRIGVTGDLTFPSDNDGNLGPVDLEIGFKAPDGAGLSIAAGSAVKGGGYLFHDEEKGRYAGTAQLKVPSGLTLSAVGLLTTELPDGSDDFSLFVMIAGEFSPVPIGFGFTLNGVGGLLGINRRFRKQALQDVVRRGELESVLFPEKVVENAKQIISNVHKMFPPKRGTHLFGPVVKIEYGSPTTMAFSLGVVLEIPSFRVAILGGLELGLPGLKIKRPPGTPKEIPWPQVKLNLDVVGLIDIPNKWLSIDATIYDSWVMLWTIKGDLALRARWGDRSQFLASFGGFHPAYDPPKNVPDLTRLTVALDVPGGTPTVTFKGYMAVTSNTFQVGAKVHAEVDKGQVFVSGTLGFDALFQFAPFKFRFDFLVSFTVEVGGFELSAGVDGRITGPDPLRIQGKAHVNPPAMPKVSANFDVSLGKDGGAVELPAAAVLPELVGAFEEPKNWDASLPRSAESPVSFAGVGARTAESGQRMADSDGDEPSGVEAHPLGTLAVSQGTVPLKYTIEKFGEAKPGTYNRFRIGAVSAGADSESVATSPVSGEFAPAKYTSMSQSEKLQSPDFVEKRAGTTVGDTSVFAGGESDPDNATSARFIYEEQVYDREDDRWGETPENASKVGHSAHVARRLVADRQSSQTDDKGRFNVNEGSATDGDAEALFGVSETEYVVVDTDDFQRVDTAVRGDVVGPDELAEEGLPRDEALDLRSQLAETPFGQEHDLAVVTREQFESTGASRLVGGAGR